MRNHLKGIGLLAVGQAMFVAASMVHLSVSGLAGRQVTDVAGLATLPLGAMALATLFGMMPLARVIEMFGRRKAFALAGALGVGAGLAGWAGIAGASLVLLVVSGILLGLFQALAQFYRFTAADWVAGDEKGRAISLVLAGGVIAALVAPLLLKGGLALSYLAIAALGAVALLMPLGLPASPPASGPAAPAGIRFWDIVRRPVFIRAVAASAGGYTVMVLAMVATPLAMAHHGHGIGPIGAVIAAHVLGMYLPSFVAAPLIRRLGAERLIAAGAAILTASALAAGLGHGEAEFTLALVLLGVGWNFLFVGGSTILAGSYAVEERAQVQASHDLIVFATSAVAALVADGALHLLGWAGLNLALLPIVALSAWVALRRRGGRPVPG